VDGSGERSYLAALADDERLLWVVNALIDQLGPADANGGVITGCPEMTTLATRAREFATILTRPPPPGPHRMDRPDPRGATEPDHAAGPRPPSLRAINGPPKATAGKPPTAAARTVKQGMVPPSRLGPGSPGGPPLNCDCSVPRPPNSTRLWLGVR
jgi:hypothetical protein